MVQWRWYISGILIAMMSTIVQAMVFDNRFFPLFRYPFLSHQQARCTYGVRGIFMGADHAYGEEFSDDGDEGAPLFKLYGSYDQVVLDRALRKAHLIDGSLLRSDMRALSELPWRTHGKISLRGAVLELFVDATPWLGFGTSLLVGKVNSYIEFERDCKVHLAPGDAYEVLQSNKRIYDILHLASPSYSKVVFGDIDSYLRLHLVRDYWHNFNHLDAGINVGFLIPTAPAIDIYNPASIPVGGNKHFGMYVDFDGVFVLKEDVTAELFVRVSKRFARTALTRLQASKEPLNFGALVDCAECDPGVTVVASPRVQVDGLRNGLGASVAYVLTHHDDDEWKDKRSNKKSIPVPHTCTLEKLSSWGSDYFSVSVFYDFGYDKDNAFHAPIASVTVDIPFNGLVTKRVSQTHNVSLRIESRL